VHKPHHHAKVADLGGAISSAFVQDFSGNVVDRQTEVKTFALPVSGRNGVCMEVDDVTML